MSIFDNNPKPSMAEMAYGSYVTFCKALGHAPMSRDEYERAANGIPPKPPADAN